MDRKQVAKIAGTGIAGLIIGYLLQPDPTTKIVREYEFIPQLVRVEVPGPERIVEVPVLVEKEPTPHPTDCVVMRWLD